MCSSVCELVVTACIGCRTTQLQRKATGKKGPPTELECSIVEFPLLKLWNGSLFFIYHLPLCAGHGCAADFDCLRLFSCCLSLELCCPTASYSYIVLAHNTTAHTLQIEASTNTIHLRLMGSCNMVVACWAHYHPGHNCRPRGHGC